MKYVLLGIVAALVLFVALFMRTESGLGVKRISYTMYKYEKYDVFRRKSGQEFEEKWNAEHPDDPIQVRYDPIGGVYPTKINAEVVAGTLQDIFFVEDFSEFARKGILLDLTPYVEKHRAQKYVDDIYPALIDYHTIDGRLYGLPNNLNTNVLYYNPTLFDREGMPYPTADWTWKELLEAAQKLTKRDSKGRLIQTGLIPGGSTFWVVWNGGRFWDRDGRRCMIDSPESREALEFYHDLQYKHHVCPTPTELRDVSGDVNFQAGRAAMLLGGRWWTALFRNAPDLNWAVAPLPKSARGRRFAYMSTNTLSINAKTKHPDIAFQFLLYLTRPDEIRHLVDIGDSIPMHRTQEENEHFLNDPARPKGENMAYLIAMDDAVLWQGKEVFSPYFPVEEQKLIGKNFNDEFVKENADVPALLAQLQTELTAAYAQRTATPAKPSLTGFAAAVAIAICLTAGVAWWAMRNRMKDAARQ